MDGVNGLHHVTAISGPAQRNLDFYTKTLGLRFVKKTVNFDDPGTYHLYYGDATGTPGSVMTFFPWEGMAPGRAGVGETRTTYFAVPEGSLAYWRDRLAAAGVEVGDAPAFDAPSLRIADPDGTGLALIEVAHDAREGYGDAAHAIHGFGGVELHLSEAGPTAAVLTDLFGYTLTHEDGARTRYVRHGHNGAGVVDILVNPKAPAASMGAGSVHHVAFSVPDRAGQAELRAAIARAGHAVTPVIDRQYFYSVYFRSPGGVLFEVATDEPGFLTDEDAAGLGTALKLPPQHEPLRARIEHTLPPLKV